MKRVQTIGLTVLVLGLTAAVAIAAEGHGAPAGEAVAEGAAAVHHGLPWKDFFLRVVNFVLVVGIIYKFAGEKIKEFFKGRQAGIKAELEDLSARRKAAEAKLGDVEQSIANIEQERAAILAEYEKQGQALKASIVAEAERKAELVRQQAKIAASQEAKVAMEKLRTDMADMIIEAAEKILKDKLDNKAQQKLVDDYLTKVVLN